MSPLSESLRAQAARELGGWKCLGCNEPKQRSRSFCPKCYYRLPIEIRRELYKTFGEGYAEAYDAAKDWLRLNP